MAYRCIRYITHGDVELTDIEKQVVEVSKEFLSTIDDKMSDYEKYKVAYDFIAENIEYEHGIPKTGDIDVLIHKKAVCHGYATAYMYLCRLMGLECWMVGGDANGVAHAWNKVKLDGKYFNVDPTWNNEGYKYFLFKDLSNRTIRESYQIFNFPCLEDYNH